MSIRRREKAEDLWNRSEPVFGKKVPPREAYPELADLRIEVQEEGKVRPHYRKGLISLDYAGEYKNCHNRVCFQGGYCLGDIIRAAVEQRLTKKTLTVRCQGYEGSPKGRKRYGSCRNTFTLKMQLTYKQQ